MESEKNYCISTGSELVYALKIGQLEDIYNTIGLFLQKENEPAKMSGNDASDFKIIIQNDIHLYTNHPNPEISYSIFTSEGKIQWISYEQIKQLSELLQSCVAQYGKSEIITPDSSPAIRPVEIKTDHDPAKRSPAQKSDVCIRKCTRWMTNETHPEITYSICANEMTLEELTLWQLEDFRQTLHHFLEQEHDLHI